MLGFMGYIALQIALRAGVRGGSVYESNGTPTQMMDVLPPLFIALGLVLMYAGRRNDTADWTWRFWLGETTVIALFTLNSVEALPRNVLGIGAVSIVAGLCALWFRGKFWNYTMVICFEVFMALFVALAFPVMEMVLETVLKNFQQKVGEKIRAYHRQMEKHYAKKLEKK